MAQKSKAERHADICKEINTLYAKKNHDYGDRIRLGDKLARFNTLTKSGGQQVNDESVRDTLIDLANYAIMTVMELDGAERPENKEEPSLYELAVAKFGLESQILMAIEEMSELTKALLKLIRYVDYSHGDSKTIMESINEERADVTIMLKQLEAAFGKNDKMMEKKLAHLKEIVEGSNE